VDLKEKLEACEDLFNRLLVVNTNVTTEINTSKQLLVGGILLALFLLFLLLLLYYYYCYYYYYYYYCYCYYYYYLCHDLHRNWLK